MVPFSKKEKKILVSLLSILIILFSLTFFSHRNSRRVLASAEEVDQAQEIKYHIEQLLAVTLDLESRVRGYIITGEEDYLETTSTSVENIFRHLDHLKSVAVRNPLQVNRVKELEDLINEKISNSTQSIEIRKSRSREEAMVFFSTGNDRFLMSKIRTISNLMLNDEDAVLRKKHEENRANIKDFNIAFDLLLVKMAITILTVFFVLRFYFKARNKAVHDLQESKNLVQSILDNTSSIIFIKDLEGKYILMNRQYEIMFHKSKEALKGKTDYDVFSREVADVLRHNDEQVIRNKKPMEFVEDVPYQEEMKHYMSVKFPLLDGDNNVYAVCGISTDFTLRKRTEEKILVKSREIMDLFNTAPCGYQSSNDEGIIVEMNDTLLKWLGYKRDEVIGVMKTRDILSLESLPKFEYYFPNLKSGKLKSIHDIEAIYIRKDGSTFPILANTVAAYDEEGNFTFTKTSIFDISLLKQAERLISQN